MTVTAPVVTIYFGGTATDVSAYVRSVSARRGRSRELDTFTAGGCTITLKNYDRRFDPTNRTGPYFGQLVPRVRVNVTSDGIPIFDGYVEDWSYQYSVDGRAEAVVACVDGLALLSQTSLDTFTNTQDTPSARITAILARTSVNYAGATDLDPGYNLMQADTVADGANTLQYLQTIAATDFGRLFVDGSGTLRYRDRTDGVTSSPTVVFGAETDTLVQQLSLLSNATLWMDASDPRPLRVDDAAKGLTVLQDATLFFDAADPAYMAPVINFNEVELEYGSEFLYNRIVVTRSNGVAQTASDSVSIASYGIRAYTASGLLFLSDSEAELFADYLLSVYAQPVVRVARHNIVVDGLPTLHQRYVKRLEIGDLVRTVWTPLDTATGIDITSYVEGVEHVITPSGHVVNLQLTPLIDTGGFILDDVNDGILDSSRVTY